MVDGDKLFTTEGIRQLGAALIKIADRYPRDFCTEQDFFPLVLAYLHGRVPRVDPERKVRGGKVDFRVGGRNPSVIELAVIPRMLRDVNRGEVKFAGHRRASGQLNASQNRSELKKLGKIPRSQAQARYLLLLDFCGRGRKETLRAQYRDEVSKCRVKFPVRVVYVSPSKNFDFLAGS